MSKKTDAFSKFTQSDCTRIGRDYEQAIIDHLTSLGAIATKSTNSSWDVNVQWLDGRIERIECKGGFMKGGVACSARAKEVFAMSALCGPLVVYTSKMPSVGTISDCLMTLGKELGWITDVRLFEMPESKIVRYA